MMIKVLENNGYRNNTPRFGKKGMEACFKRENYKSYN